MNICTEPELDVETCTPPQLTRKIGEQPIDGYELLEPLGVGGFGEVWKCLAPGGLLKALKIVTLPPLLAKTETTPAEHELAAMDRIKQIRHPFLISIDRVDLRGGELIVVMELADASLLDEFKQNRAEGRPGIPEQQMLHYLIEAAEVLDLLNFQYGLQHLDVKPGNLLVINRHMKLADFGVVSTIGNPTADVIRAKANAVTPRYASPEMMQGNVSASSDQYSLAVVYQELLTGELPFQGNSLLKRIISQPNLQPLPEMDRPVIARALSPNAADRFPSCSQFVNALLSVRENAATRINGRPAGFHFPLGGTPSQSFPELMLPQTRSGSVRPLSESDINSHARVETPSPMARPTLSSLTVPVSETTARIPPVAGSGRRSGETARPPRDPGSLAKVVFPPVIHIAQVEAGTGASSLVPNVDEFIAQLVEAKTGHSDLCRSGQHTLYRELPGQVLEHSFPMEAVSPLTLKQKLYLAVRECRGDIMVESARFITFAVEGALPLWGVFTSKQTTLRCTIKVEAPSQEKIEFFKATVRIEPMTPDGPPLATSLLNIRPILVRNIRSIMQVIRERRMHERWPCNFGVRLYPIMPDGEMCRPIEARAGDISAQGIGLILNEKPVTSRVYIRPKSPKSLCDFAVLSEIVRHNDLADGSIALGAILGRF